MRLDLQPSLAAVDDRLSHVRTAWHELLDKGQLRMAELARTQLDTLLDIRNAVEREDGQ